MSKIKSSRQSHFAVTPAVNHPRAAYNCDHGYKASFNAGKLIPFFWDEVSPGDTHKVSATAFLRFATLLFPIMDNVKFYTHYFFIPTRLIWANSRKFFGEQVNPGDSIDYTVPSMTSTVTTGYTENSIFDYFGLPTKVAGYEHISLPLRGYNLCYNEWFRDQNLQDSVTVNTGDSSDPTTDYSLLSSCKLRDYFTSGLPFTQKGNPITIPLGTQAPVISDGSNPRFNTGTQDLQLQTTSGLSTTSWGPTPSSTSNVLFGLMADTSATGLLADLTAATSATINDLRNSFQVQRFLERDARNGTRYAELINSHFGVHFPDLRYRPEYLGGSSDPMHVSVVAQTSGTGQTGQNTPQANLSGIGTGVLHDHGYSKSFTEHGYVIGIILARADLNYQQGLNKKWTRSVRYDYPWPVLAHLGEQPILNKELYIQGTANPTEDEAVFAYNERYAECRYRPSVITSLFRSNATLSLDAWHLAQDFGSLPTLNSAFIVDNPPTDRVKATTTDPDFIMDMQIKQTTVSCLPAYSVPGYIDHF